MDVTARLPGCGGQAADAVSAFSQVKKEDAPKLLKKIPNRNVQIFGFVYHDTNGLNHGPVWKTQSFLLSEICMVLWERQFEKKKKPIEVRLGEGFQLRMFIREP